MTADRRLTAQRWQDGRARHRTTGGAAVRGLCAPLWSGAANVDLPAAGHVCSLAAGEGDPVFAAFDPLLQLLRHSVCSDVCRHCGAVSWLPVTPQSNWEAVLGQ